ncbi:MAG: redoxin domain-containing protein [Planctomycetes bacterium]|nr:redoxin domain-containing protein [Planctomycetota bacterium]
MSTRTLLAPLVVALSLACAGDASLPSLGSDAPDVTLQHLDGSSYALSSLRGKTVLLNFWFYH